MAKPDHDERDRIIRGLPKEEPSPDEVTASKRKVEKEPPPEEPSPEKPAE